MNKIDDAVSEITGMMSSLPVFGDSALTSVAENIKKHLITIKGAVKDPDQNDDIAREGLENVTEVVNGLLDLVADHAVDAALLQNRSKHSKIRSLFSLCNLTRRSPTLKLEEIEEKLEEVAAHADAIKLSPKSVGKSTNSDAEEQEIEFVGRKLNKEQIMNRLLMGRKAGGVVPVFPIVGIEGMGKTKLAKAIWDDEKVESDFDLRIWIDGIPADDKSYAEFVVKHMIESAMKKKLEKEDSVVVDQNLNLRKAISGGRFLLVLDDLQNEDRDEWLKLQQALKEAAGPTGGAVLITTQNDIVNRIVGPFSPLPELSEEDSWSLFKQIARVSEITDIQKKMLKKCGGVPVAIITMARLLSSREAIVESEMNQWEKEFRQGLQLRYYNKLPSRHLKQCFAYSSFIFFKGASVDTQTLIRLWMAEGFLEPTNSSSSCDREPEDLGREYIDEFRRRSIFHACETEFGILKKCSMPSSLMRDLATFVSGDDSFCMDHPNDEVKQGVRRVSMTAELEVSKGIKSVSKQNKKLRTKLHTILIPAARRSSRVPYEVKLSWSACDAIFSKFKRLRVLKLQDLGMKMLPNSIGELNSLRHLNLSHNNMKKLPNSIGKLENLQTLNLSHCHMLKELPNTVKDLKSLRHLQIEACLNLKQMPSTLKNLTWLRTLSHFVASRSKNHNHTEGLLELANLNNLRGELEILHLERASFKESDPEGNAYLKDKQHLQCLTLRWNHDEEECNEDNDHNNGHNSQNTRKYPAENDQISLRLLKPHPNLQALSIVRYQGNGFSDWLLSLKKLVQLSLDNCHKCRSLPPLDQLPELKILQLQRLESLEFITDQCYDGGDYATKPFFPSLKELTILDCPNLTTWWERTTRNNNAANAVSFPCISFLRVEYCPKLDCMPLFPSLEEWLVLECSSMKPLLETLNYGTCTSTSNPASDSDSSPPLSQLKYIYFENVEQQSFMPEEWLKNFISLQQLQIEKCKDLKSLLKGFKYLSSLFSLHITNCTDIDLPSDEWNGLKNLHILIIAEIPKLKSLPKGIKHLSSLYALRIYSCPELTTLTNGIGGLQSLTSLWIYECHKLASLPKAMENVTSLKTLRIRNCPLLLPRCQRENGVDWEHIKHIKDISLKEPS